jgi:hypothetical protein
LAGAFFSVTASRLFSSVIAGVHDFHWDFNIFAIPLGLIAGFISNQLIKNNHGFNSQVGSYFLTIFLSIFLTLAVGLIFIYIISAIYSI